MQAAPHNANRPSIPSLVGGIFKDAINLISNELTAARLEVYDELEKAKSAVLLISLGAGALMGYQAEQRPWLMMGISIVAGYLLSRSILTRAEPGTAIVNWPDNGTRGRIALGRQSAGFIGGIVSAVVVALARDLAMSLLTKRGSRMRGNSDHSGQTKPVGR